MQLQLLGCGASTGVPAIGCNCPVCTSPDPRNKRLRTSAVIRMDNGQNILIDATPDLRTQCLTWKVQRVDAILFTHAHADHIFGIDDLRGFNFAQRASIPCYGSPDTAREIRRFFHYIFNPLPNYQGGSLAKLDLQEITPFAKLELLGTELQTFELRHGPTMVNGFRIGNLGYATDCNLIPERSMEILRGVKTLFLNALRPQPHPTHYTIGEAVEVAKQIGAERTILVHMTHAVDFETVSASLPNGVELAQDGMVVAIH